jgi:hypothetical protein
MQARLQESVKQGKSLQRRLASQEQQLIEAKAEAHALKSRLAEDLSTRRSPQRVCTNIHHLQIVSRLSVPDVVGM